MISTTLELLPLTHFPHDLCNRRFFLQLIVYLYVFIFFAIFWLRFPKSSPSARLLYLPQAFQFPFIFPCFFVHFPFSNQNESSLSFFLRDPLWVKMRKRTKRLPTAIMRHENESNPISRTSTRTSHIILRCNICKYIKIYIFLQFVFIVQLIAIFFSSLSLLAIDL